VATELMAPSTWDSTACAAAAVDTLAPVKPTDATSRSSSATAKELPEPLLNPTNTEKVLLLPLNKACPLNSVVVDMRSISDRKATNS